MHQEVQTMSSLIAIGLIALFFVLSLFVKKLNHWKVMPIIYLVCTIIIGVDAITGATPRYISLFFIVLGIYGIVTSFRESRTPDGRALGRPES